MTIKKDKTKMTTAKSTTAADKTIISEATPVRIGLVLAFLTAFGSAIYWGSSITSKLDTLIAFQTTVNTTIVELKAADANISKEFDDMKLKSAIQEVAIKALQDRLNNPSVPKP